jgi:hypothetical protein
LCVLRNTVRVRVRVRDRVRVRVRVKVKVRVSVRVGFGCGLGLGLGLGFGFGVGFGFGFGFGFGVDVGFLPALSRISSHWTPFSRSPSRADCLRVATHQRFTRPSVNNLVKPMPKGGPKVKKEDLRLSLYVER